MLGHGVLVETRSLVRVGGFPQLVSEDLAVTIAMAEAGLVGVIAFDIVGFEEFPRDYRSYWNRRRRWIQADAELIGKMMGRLLRCRVPVAARADLLARELRLPLGSIYWLLLVVASVFSFTDVGADVHLPAVAWAAALTLVAPVSPAFAIGRLDLSTRLRFVLAATVVGAATVSLHPIASYLGLRGRHEFISTGSWHRSRVVARSQLLYSCWEVASGLLFCVGGVVGKNWALSAMGLAAVCSPLLRRTSSNGLLAITATVFWGLITAQIVIDIADGSVPIEHLLVLCGLAITVI
jgi:hypothetical protein